jgi:site-specific DNA recombinase
MDAYIRVSDVAGREGERYGSPELQRKAIEEAAQRHGVSLGEEVVEEDVSGAKRSQDRRLQWRRYQANYATSRERAIGRGAFPTRTPYGYSREQNGSLVLDPDTAAIVRDIFVMRGSGRTIAEISRALVERGTVSPTGRPAWSHSTIAQILRNRVYLGEQRHGEFERRDAHDPIVSDAEFASAKVAKPLRTPEARAHSSGALLAGIAHCAGCGHTLKIVTGYGERLRYYCKGPYASGPCPARCLIRVDELDPYVEAWFLAAIKDNVRVASAERATRRAVEAQEAVEAATESLYAFVKLGDALRPELFTMGVRERETTLELAKLELAEATSEGRLYGDIPSGDLLAAWPQLSIKRRRQLIGAFVDRVNVRRAPDGNLAVADRVQFVRDGAVIAPEQVGEVLAEDR